MAVVAALAINCIRGRLDPAAYELIGNAYERVEQREAWLIDAKPVTEIGVVIQPNADADDKSTGGTEAGVTRMLTQLKHQFDFVTESSDWSDYELLILPDAVTMTKTLLEKVRAHLKAGRKLLATGTSGLSPDVTEVLLPSLGIKPLGWSPYTTTYLRLDTDHAMYDRSVRVTETKEATSLAKIVEPYFERTWQHFSSHFQTPPSKLSEYSAAVLNGNCGYIAYPIFASYAQHANLPCRRLVASVLEKLLPEPLVRVKSPSSTEVTVTQQDGRVIVHLLQYCPERRAKDLDLIEDVVPLYNVELSLRVEKKPSRVYRLTPQPETLVFDYRNGRASVVIPEIRGHEMIIFEV